MKTCLRRLSPITQAAPGDLEAQLRFIFEEIRDSIAGLGASMSELIEVVSYRKDPAPGRW